MKTTSQINLYSDEILVQLPFFNAFFTFNSIPTVKSGLKLK